jgi:hypothetical protein
MSLPVNPNIAKEFLDAFEEVFERDWSHTKSVLGIHAETKEQTKASAERSSKLIPVVAEDGNFVQSKVEDEVEDWASRGRSLAAYSELKKAMS